MILDVQCGFQQVMNLHSKLTMLRTNGIFASDTNSAAPHALTDNETDNRILNLSADSKSIYVSSAFLNRPPAGRRCQLGMTKKLGFVGLSD